MSFISTTALAFSMSADAFAVSIAKGASQKHHHWREALRCGAIFGVVEAITPILGWCIGLAAAQFIAAIDHWIAFVILGIVGGKLVWESFHAEEEAATQPKRHGLGLLVFTAFGTSIDALAVGVTLAFLDANIWINAAAIGAATFLMATLGIKAGHYLGTKVGKYAERLGGIALIAIGCHILLSHLAMV